MEPDLARIRIAAAQSPSIPGDVAANVRTHLRFMDAAHAAQVDVLVFPELSLCGYELPMLQDCCLLPEDAQLAPIRDLARATGMTVVLGSGLRAADGGKPHIAAFTIGADGSTAVYCKQYLHPGEEQYCTPGAMVSPLAACRGEAYALAICADTAHPQHARAAAAAGARLYLAGVLVSQTGYAVDAALLQGYAADWGMGVLMANHGAPSGGYVSAGRSAFWEGGGRQVVVAPGSGSYLVIATRQSGWWSGECRHQPG